jgi:hypothetical protein
LRFTFTFLRFLALFCISSALSCNLCCDEHVPTQDNKVIGMPIVANPGPLSGPD